MSIFEFVIGLVGVLIPLAAASQLWVHRMVDSRIKYLEMRLDDCLGSVKSEKD